MKKKRLFVSFLIVLICILPAFAEDFLVIFMEGKASVRQGSRWHAVEMGDDIAVNSTIRVEKGGLIELSYRDTTVTISSGGTYKLKDLVKSSKQMKNSTFLASVDNKLKSIGGSSEYHQRRSVAMGVRGESRDPGVRGESMGDIEWAEEKYDPLSEGEKLLGARKYDKAIEYLTSIADEWKGTEEEKFLYYYLAYAYSEKNMRAQALKYLDMFDFSPEHGFYEDFVLLKGSLLVESFSYSKALAIFHTFLKGQKSIDSTQSVLILGAYCYRGLGDRKNQKNYLNRAVSLDPDSDLGKEAAQMLKGL